MTVKSYSVVEIFGTVQGEGSRAGARSVFVRFGGCNAWNGRPQDRAKGKGACAAWCDTLFTGGRRKTSKAIIETCEREWGSNIGPKWVVLSGGEPLLQVDEALVTDFYLAGWLVAIETNGSIYNPVLNKIDHVCVSPKRGMDFNVLHGTELKVVLPGGRDPRGSDGWTEQELDDLAALPFKHHYLQPQDPIDPDFVEVSKLHGNAHDPGLGRRYHDNVTRVLELVKRDPRWRVSLQSHKLLGVR